jgi:DNA-binding NtrC family response regulator
MLFREFMATASKRGGRADLEPAPSVLQRMLEYSWPGNVRELKHVADFLAATAEGERIELSDLPSQFAAVAAPPAVMPVPVGNHDAPMRRLADELEEIERQRMTEALTRTGGVKTRAAILIGMPLRTFNMKAKLYGL